MGMILNAGLVISGFLVFVAMNGSIAGQLDPMVVLQISGGQAVLLMVGMVISGFLFGGSDAPKAYLHRTKSYGDSSDDVKSYVLQVHGVVVVGLCLSAYGAKLHLDSASPFNGSDWWTIVQMLCFFVLGVSEVTMDKNNGLSLWRLSAFLVCAFAAGINVGTWVENALEESGLCKGRGWSSIPDFDLFNQWTDSKGATPCAQFNIILYYAMLLTGGAYAAFFLAALVAPRGSGQMLVPFVMCGLYIMSLTYWITRMFNFGKAAFDLIYIQIGLAVYCAKIFVDTQELYEQATHGKRDVVSHALRMLMNILHLFIRIIKLTVKALKFLVDNDMIEKKNR